MAQRTTRRPLIGVTAGTRAMMSGAWAGHDAVVVTEHYVRAIRDAGARPVIIAPQDEWTDEEIAELDGLVLTGGTDLDPATWGESALVTDMTPDPERDAFETALYRGARRTGVPVLGICRGLQIIVIAEGGELHRHLPVDVPSHPATGERPTRVEVGIEAASDLAVALGTRAEVTAFHHQGVRAVAGDLRVVARHDSGLPLAVEAASGSTVLAVQWHPEIDGADGAQVFESLLTAIEHRAATASGPALV
ncbi:MULTISPECIES: gamma-glutamyl-gamma-aminobutyrate hydrolase family protein [Brachybacterium]|uniref:gamma-glutamyl-gamma-aminobutyrate hydrolase family protein n=1 Tax=Brachybacterium TaxID=43668 RepID=UPI000BB872D0|nr:MULTISPECIES: gamma-glutamyl-gamma-aminobutyrate hydrolase family protein [Brachybacterium]PCC31504.1 gamma-glutamyl-gamma-aminobutyrate hydrolase [Brachybacterium alimentarium]RCS65068.1 gamma-glutamyl-gamma-aminobutyrate hydrolase family protein [Brachybacterium sp. JB7]RCS76188.1 gamma-glutamyl-gamma-aminobutyrate hydrolase family protein [Brachybacterium alimentarium]RCS81878.1 gamma-glutamyl-gamma-aminobutyrate hydrolase family protein [Brachybacterium alimentarium]RCS85654.1 gamma-glu